MKIILFTINHLLLATIFFSCGESKKPVTEGNVTRAPVVEGTEVSCLKAKKEVMFPGELLPWSKVNIYSKVKGFVKTLKADRGTKVKKGQVLAVLEAPEILAQVNEALGQLQAAESALTEAETIYRTSRSLYERLLDANQTTGAVSPFELEKALETKKNDSASVLKAEGNLSAARSFYRHKLQMKEYLTIEAPFDGTVIERNLSEGALTGAADAKSVPLFVLQDNSKLRLTVAIPENYANAITPSAEVSFSVNAFPGKTFNAKFGRSSESVLQNKRVMMTEFDFDNKDEELKAGMYAEVNMPIVMPENSLFVPNSSVVTSSQKIFVIRSREGKAEWVKIEKGITLDTLIEVFGNLKAGDTIVKNASEEIRENEKIIIQK